MGLYAPMQNGLVERFNRVITEKIKEAGLFGWILEEASQATLFHYRSTPHATTEVSPFEALFEKRMRNALTNLYPDASRIPATQIDRELVEVKQQGMK